MFSYFIVQTQIATNLATWVVSLHLPPVAVMIVVIFFYIALGSFLQQRFIDLHHLLRRLAGRRHLGLHL